MNREEIYEIIESMADTDHLAPLESFTDEELIKVLLELGKEEEKNLETDIDWDWVRREMNDQEWYESDGGFDEERQVYLGTVFSLMPSGKYYLPFACSNVELCPLCDGNGSYGKMTCKICRGEGKRGVHPDDDISTLDLIHEGQKCMGCRGSGKTTISCDYCESLGSREAYLDSIMQEKLEDEAEEHGFFITSGEGDPCDIMAGETREIEIDTDQQDFVDNAIHSLFRELNAGQEIDWNIEAIGKVRDVALDVMKRHYNVIVEYP